MGQEKLGGGVSGPFPQTNAMSPVRFLPGGSDRQQWLSTDPGPEGRGGGRRRGAVNHTLRTLHCPRTMRDTGNPPPRNQTHSPVGSEFRMSCTIKNLAKEFKDGLMTGTRLPSKHFRENDIHKIPYCVRVNGAVGLVSVPGRPPKMLSL